jgi:hypothetical protein
MLYGNSADPVAVANVQRFFLTFPLAFVLGWHLSASSSSIDMFGKMYGILAGVVGAMAVAEVAYGSSFFSRDEAFAWLVREGGARALLGAEHALVLGVLLAAAPPFIIALYRGWPRVLLLALSLGGIVATGSRGALVLGVVAAIACMMPKMAQSIARRRLFIGAAILTALATLWYLASAVWEPATYSRDWSQNSLEYRAAIYSLLPSILHEMPIGAGLGSLPSGEWFIRAPDRVIDVSRSVDSQLVLSGLRLGWVGVFLFLGAIVICVIAARTRLDVGLAGIVVTLSGTFLALDAWDGLGVVWLLIIGSAAGIAARNTAPSGVRKRGYSSRAPSLDPLSSSIKSA